MHSDFTYFKIIIAHFESLMLKYHQILIYI